MIPQAFSRRVKIGRRKTWENSRLWIGTTGEISTVQFVQKNPFLFVRVYPRSNAGTYLDDERGI